MQKEGAVSVMEIRQLKADEFEERMALSQFAFQFQLTPERMEAQRRTYRAEHDWGAFDEQGALLSALIIIPFESWIQGKKFAMGGIAGVATWPEARRQGCVSKLLVHSLETMRKNGQTFSMLHPFAFSFYRKYGWEMTVERKKYTIEASQLPPRLETTGRVKRISKPDLALLDEIYSTYASRYSGTLVRTPEWWETKIVSKDGTVAVYYNDADEPEGYVFYQVANRTLTVHDWVSISETSRKALWSFIGNHDSMIDQVTVVVPVDDSLPFLLADPRVKQEVIPYFMSRIVDAEAFVGLYPWAAGDREESVILSLTDSHARWNNDVYHLTWSVEGSARVERLEEEAASREGVISCDIQALTAMLTGNRKPSFLRQVGRISGTAENVERLERRIPERMTYLMDFF
jgi:predicted acetyltransferase